VKPREILLGLAAALLLALALSPLASPRPDGLERVAADKGFLQKGEGKPALTAPLPDYTWPGIKSESLSTRIAGMIGTLAAFVITLGAAALLGLKRGGAGSAGRTCVHRK
jgi:cobalt/nickel transport protein